TAAKPVLARKLRRVSLRFINQDISRNGAMAQRAAVHRCVAAPLREKDSYCALSFETLHLDGPLHFPALRILSQYKITPSRNDGQRLHIAARSREEPIHSSTVDAKHPQLHVVPIHVLRAL